MGLKDTIKSAYDAAIKAADDTVTSATYTVLTPGLYDPVTDTSADTTVDIVVSSAFFYGLNDTEVDWFPADWVVQKWIIHLDELNGNVPKSEDYVTKDGEVWRINRIKVLPGETTFILYLTRS